MPHRIAYISQGRLFLKSEGSREEEIASDFVRNLKKRLQSVEDRASFRSGGSGAQFMRGGMPAAQVPTVEDTFTSEFSCAAKGTEGQVCYAIDARDVRGLFIYDLAEKYERRVLHGPKHRFTSISVRPGGDGQEWLVAAAQDEGVSRIGLFTPDAGGGVRELTEGDSIDSYPAWEPGQTRRFVYQSCGVARDHRSGFWQGLGPASIQQVNMDTGAHDPLLEDDRFDYLCPTYAADGTLYYLKRPYEPFHKTSALDVAKDIVLFPFRLMRAIFSFLNVFSMLFSGKPLQTSGAPKREGPDPKAVFLHGRWVNMEKAMRQAAVDEATSAVPRNWELMSQSPNGEEKTVLQGVMAFCIGAGGDVYFSNGKGVFVLKGGTGAPVKIHDKGLVTELFEM